MPKQYYINQLEKGLAISDEPFGIGAIKKGTDRNNNPYLDLELVDRTGMIKAKIWSDNLERIPSKLLQEGTIVKVSGLVGEFNGNLQMTINGLSKYEEKDLSDFLPVTKASIDDMWKKMTTRVENMNDQKYKTLLQKLFALHEEKIRLAPAAKNIHHNYVGGLLEHVTEMMDIAETVMKLYPEADPDLVFTGIIFHDIGKIYELEIEGFVIDYSKVGKMIGHIALGIRMLDQLDKDILEEEQRMLLEHIILSHHSILEYGSPVVPKTIEAMIVAKVDDLSSKVRTVQKVLSDNAENDKAFSAREYAIGSEVYLGK